VWSFTSVLPYAPSWWCFGTGIHTQTYTYIYIHIYSDHTLAHVTGNSSFIFLFYHREEWGSKVLRNTGTLPHEVLSVWFLNTVSKTIKEINLLIYFSPPPFFRWGISTGFTTPPDSPGCISRHSDDHCLKGYYRRWNVAVRLAMPLCTRDFCNTQQFRESSLYVLPSVLYYFNLKLLLENISLDLKVKFSLCLTKHHAMKMYGWMYV
jgi:hypothetical protein